MRILFEIIKINVIYHWWFLYFWGKFYKMSHGKLREEKLADVTYTSISIIIYLLMNVIFFYSIIYFFIAHYKVYHTHGVISFIIGSILFMFNFFAFMFFGYWTWNSKFSDDSLKIKSRTSFKIRLLHYISKSFSFPNPKGWKIILIPQRFAFSKACYHIISYKNRRKLDYRRNCSFKIKKDQPNNHQENNSNQGNSHFLWQRPFRMVNKIS